MARKFFKCIVSSFSLSNSLAASDLLLEKGYLSVSCLEKTEDKWAIEILSAVPIEENDISAVLAKYGRLSLETSCIEDEDWLAKCFANFKPIVVGSFYMLGPHLYKNKKPADKIQIEIAAATAFGTGEHPTTSGCLLACETFFDPETHKSALDIGCGSGILGIALAKLGAKRVAACDNDLEAVRVAKKNAAMNRVAHRISVFQNFYHEFDINKYDFIVANILEVPLISLAEAILKSLNERGILILSGFNAAGNNVLRKYQSLGLILKYEYIYKDWSTLVFRK